NFGFAADPRPGAIAGKVFDDSNGDGKLSPGEIGAGNVTVVADWSGGTPATKERSVQTASDGSYRLDELPTGSYHVSFYVPDHATGSLESIPIPAVTAIPGQSVAGPNLGFIRDATVRGFVFDDVNGNGVRDPDESPLPHVRVHVQLVHDGFEDTDVYFQTSV